MLKLRNQLWSRRVTGRCPICGKKARRITCGTEKCIRRWLLMDTYWAKAPPKRERLKSPEADDNED